MKEPILLEMIGDAAAERAAIQYAGPCCAIVRRVSA